MSSGKRLDCGGGTLRETPTHFKPNYLSDTVFNVLRRKQKKKETKLHEISPNVRSQGCSPPRSRPVKCQGKKRPYNDRHSAYSLGLGSYKANTAPSSLITRTVHIKSSGKRTTKKRPLKMTERLHTPLAALKAITVSRQPNSTQLAHKTSYWVPFTRP
jgi:hypothetical protein